MDRFQNILVGVDLSEDHSMIRGQLSANCRSAVDKALWLASQTSAHVTFFTSQLPCLDLTPAMWQLAELQNYRSVMDSVDANARDQLNTLVEEAESAGVQAKSVCASGKPWIELLREAVTNNYDLVIVGSHKQHALGRLLLGSTGRRLVRKCPCPVWVTSPVEGGQIRKILPMDFSNTAVEPLKILVPMDFSETAVESLQLAGALARKLATELHVLHVVEYHFEPQMRDLIVSFGDMEGHRSRTRSDAERQLTEVISQCGLSDIVPRAHQHVTVGQPDVMIREAVRELSIGLVVMNTLGRSGINGVLIGNTAEQVLNHLTCSILAIKPAGFHCPIEFPEWCERQEVSKVAVHSSRKTPQEIGLAINNAVAESRLSPQLDAKVHLDL